MADGHSGETEPRWPRSAVTTQPAPLGTQPRHAPYRRIRAHAGPLGIWDGPLFGAFLELTDGSWRLLMFAALQAPRHPDPCRPTPGSAPPVFAALCGGPYQMRDGLLLLQRLIVGLWLTQGPAPSAERRCSIREFCCTRATGPYVCQCRLGPRRSRGAQGSNAAGLSSVGATFSRSLIRRRSGQPRATTKPSDWARSAAVPSDLDMTSEARTL